MPRPDPLPPGQTPGQPNMMRRFWRIFRLLSLFAIAVAGIAVVLVAKGDEGVHIHMLIATALGAGLTVMIGAALMTLVFLSASSGHDAEAGRKADKEAGDK